MGLIKKVVSGYEPTLARLHNGIMCIQLVHGLHADGAPASKIQWGEEQCIANLFTHACKTQVSD